MPMLHWKGGGGVYLCACVNLFYLSISYKKGCMCLCVCAHVPEHVCILMPVPGSLICPCSAGRAVCTCTRAPVCVHACAGMYWAP